MVFNTDSIIYIGLSYLNFKGAMDGSTPKNVERFRCAYGVDPRVCMAIEEDLQEQEQHQPIIHHVVKTCAILMTLYWLYHYPTETMLCSMFGYQREQTVREYIWKYCQAISALRSIKVRFPCFKIVCTLAFLTFCLFQDSLELRR